MDAFDNLSSRPPGDIVSVAARLSHGVASVEEQIPVYAAEWRARNRETLSWDGPLWVVLGDSLSQGIGASSVDQGWVMQAHRMLSHARRYRLLNLSISGARVSDVLERELPAMSNLVGRADLVTVLIGSNDVVKRRLREQLPGHFRTLLSSVPAGSFVGTVSHPHGVERVVRHLVCDAASRGDVHPVTVEFARGERASDHFHPNNAGHRAIAESFISAITAVRSRAV